MILCKLYDKQWKIQQASRKMIHFYAGFSHIVHRGLIELEISSTQNGFVTRRHWSFYYNSSWLVVDLPLWKIWVRQLGLFFPKYGNIKNVPNHQPVLKTQFLAEFIIVGCWFLVNICIYHYITLIQPKSSTSHGCSPNWKSTWHDYPMAGRLLVSNWGIYIYSIYGYPSLLISLLTTG